LLCPELREITDGERSTSTYLAIRVINAMSRSINGKVKMMDMRAFTHGTHNNGKAIARRLLAGVTLFSLLFLAMINVVGAEKVDYSETGTTQNGFTSWCRENGGKPHREAKHVVSCTEKTKTTTCDFNQEPGQCKEVSQASTGGGTIGAAVEGDLNSVNNDIQPAAPVASTAGDINGGAITAEPTEQAAPVGAMDASIEAADEPVSVNETVGFEDLPVMAP
jgi:hypothetical protein